MAFVVKYTYVRPNTDVEFPRVSDYDSDFDYHLTLSFYLSD